MVVNPPILWTATDIARATRGAVRGDFDATGVSIDSRTVTKGDLFIALSGPNFDGHAFVADAFERGAAGALVSGAVSGAREQALGNAEQAMVVVEDTLEALTALGAAGRDRARATVIGITGSVGKTGTKDMTACALGALGTVHASTGSFNNHFGLPLTLARLAPDVDFAVVEMGMNHAGELRALTRVARPDIAVVTTVESVHLEFFKDVAAIAEAKAEIFEGVTDGGAAILYRDNAFFGQLSATARACGIDRIIGFGEGADSNVRLIDFNPRSGRNRVTASVDGETFVYELAIDGRHWATNSLAVLAAVRAIGGDLAAATQAMSGMPAPEGRGARHHFALATGPVEVIDDSYNAGPVSMRAALAVLSDAEPAPGGRRIAVLGDMLELGSGAARFHSELASDVMRHGIDQVFTAGPLMAALFEALPAGVRGRHAGSADSLIQPLVETLRAGDVLLVKGSHGSAMHRVVAALGAFASQNAHGDDWPRAANGDC